MFFKEIKSENIFEELGDFLTVPFDIKYVTLHWTAGRYNQPSKHYHINIDGDKILVSNHIATKWHSHTWKRNSGNIGVTFMAMYNATQKDIGDYPVTPDMVETCAKVLAKLKAFYNLPWESIVDHAYWAKIDNYEGLRWDCAYVLPGGKTIYEETLSKAKWYYNRYLKNVK